MGPGAAPEEPGAGAVPVPGGWWRSCRAGECCRCSVSASSWERPGPLHPARPVPGAAEWPGLGGGAGVPWVSVGRARCTAMPGAAWTDWLGEA